MSVCDACGIHGDGRKIRWSDQLGGSYCGARNPSDTLSRANCQVRVERARARAHLARFTSHTHPGPLLPPPPPLAEEGEFDPGDFIVPDDHESVAGDSEEEDQAPAPPPPAPPSSWPQEALRLAEQLNANLNIMQNRRAEMDELLDRNLLDAPIQMVIPGPARVREMMRITAERIAIRRFQTVKTAAEKMMETLDDYKERMPEQCYLELANLSKNVYDSSVRNF